MSTKQVFRVTAGESESEGRAEKRGCLYLLMVARNEYSQAIR